MNWMDEEYLSPELEAAFPNLRRGEYRKTSEETVSYNCIAHAAEANDLWWWPARGPGIFWPPEAPLEETVESFIQAYAAIGYEVCEIGSREPEPGFQKIALYVDEDGIPTHAARQLSTGEWTSKLGRSEDIAHRTLEALESGEYKMLGYGSAVLILKRPDK
jgi:hypothetical protein